MPTTESEVRLAYRLFLGRLPGDNEVANMMKNCQNLEDLRRVFMSSLEFRNKFWAHLEKNNPHSSPTIVHLHIPKTAGTSLNSILFSNFGSDEIVHGTGNAVLQQLQAMPPERLRQVKLVVGHVLYGIHTQLPQRHLYLCMMRLPGPRLFSFYKYILRAKDHPLNAKLNAEAFSFGDFLRFAANEPNQRFEFDNGQIRQIAGKIGPAWLGREAELLQTAQDNLFRNDMIFGFQERFSDFLRELSERKVIPFPQERYDNASPKAETFEQAVAELTDEERAILADFCRWDQQLYDAAMRHKDAAPAQG